MSSARLIRQTGMDAKNLATRYDLPTLDWAPIADAPGSAPDASTGLRRARIGTPAGWRPSTATAPRTSRASARSGWTAPSGSRPVADTRKGRNLARDPRCSLSVATAEFDLTVKGEASLITDPATVAGWRPAGPRRLAVPGSTSRGVALTAEFSAPSAGPAAVARLPDHAQRRRRSPRRTRRRHVLRW